MDPRFSKVHTDPRFIKAKKDAHKVAIDKRFAHMLESEEFGTVGKVAVDKRGRPQKSTPAQDLKRFYKIEENEEEEEEESSESEGETGARLDLARGEGLQESSEEESELEELAEEEVESGPWADEDIPMGEETSRIGVVNLDWDNVKAKDLYKVFASFVPARGQLKKVSVIPSEFGKERIAFEALNGPPTEVFQSEKEEKLIPTDTNNDEGKDFNMVALRKYQVERLKYYFAVAEFDSVQTARTVFAACDGTEYESSANIFDLRYIPDDMTFDEPPRDVATEAPLAYEPSAFITQALQHSNVKLTWDGEDPERIKTTKKKFSKEDLKDMDFKAYLASDSEEEEVDEDLKAKYKALLDVGNDEEEPEEMEITFTPGLSEKAESLLQKKKEEKERANENVFEAQLRKQREKKKAKKMAKHNDKSEDESEDDMEGRDDLDDPFFQDAFGSEFDEPEQPKEKPTKTKKKLTKAEIEEREKSKAELELLLVDDDKSKQHFSAKDVLKAEKAKSKKQKKKLNKVSLDTQDDFKIDLQDSRFGGLLNDHEFSIDPTSSHFKKTKAMQEILEKKRTVNMQKLEPTITKHDEKAELKNLVQSVKRKNELSKNKSGKRQRNL